MNPEAQERADQVAKLRDMALAVNDGRGLGEVVSPRSLGIVLDQAANEIEALGNVKDAEGQAFAKRLHMDLAASLVDFTNRETGWEPQIKVSESEENPYGFTLRAECRVLTIDLLVHVKRQQ